jgi:hypothetical protein
MASCEVPEMSQPGFSSSNPAKQLMNMVTGLSWVFPKQSSLGLDGWPSKTSTTHENKCFGRQFTGIPKSLGMIDHHWTLVGMHRDLEQVST